MGSNFNSLYFHAHADAILVSLLPAPQLPSIKTQISKSTKTISGKRWVPPLMLRMVQNSWKKSSYSKGDLRPLQRRHQANRPDEFVGFEITWIYFRRNRTPALVRAQIYFEARIPALSLDPWGWRARTPHSPGGNRCSLVGTVV